MFDYKYITGGVIMKILLTNDDGVYADGLRALAKALIAGGHNIFIVAPDRERSAAGHSITISDPLRAKKVKLGIGNINSYKVNGTPADCVKLGLEKLVDFEPDLIISGINDGPNLGYDVLYSGTVSAAMEGWMMGYTSIAVSLATKIERDFDYGAYFIEDLIKNSGLTSIEEKMLLNINIPDQPKDRIKGVIVTTLGKSLYEDSFEERVDPMGNTYYWLTGNSSSDDFSVETDIWAITHKYISITPLKINLTDLKQINILKEKIK